MKRILIPIVLCALFLSACAQKPPSYAEGVSEACIQLQTSIEEELLTDATPLEEQIRSEVTLRVIHWEGDVAHVVVSAPDISEELLAWLRNLPEEEYGDDALLEEIDRLLAETAPSVSRFELPVINLQPQYPGEMLNAVHCGLDVFFLELQKEALMELGGEAP